MSNRARPIATLDLFETQAVIAALDTEIEWIEVRLARTPKPKRLEVSYLLEARKALRNRLNKKFAPAYAQLTQAVEEPAHAR